jgi:hypothetical protein
MEPSRRICCTQDCCKAPVPTELEIEHLCVLHFIALIENTCADMRRETTMDRTPTNRRSEMADYIKTTAMKLSFVATGSARLTDDTKKRILTTFMTLMNLQENIERSSNRFVRLTAPKSAPSISLPVAVAS